jgi:hypothetical protein
MKVKTFNNYLDYINSDDKPIKLLVICGVR